MQIEALLTVFLNLLIIVRYEGRRWHARCLSHTVRHLIWDITLYEAAVQMPRKTKHPITRNSPFYPTTRDSQASIIRYNKKSYMETNRTIVRDRPISYLYTRALLWHYPAPLQPPSPPAAECQQQQQRLEVKSRPVRGPTTLPLSPSECL